MADLDATNAAWDEAHDALEKAGDHASESVRARERMAWHQLLRAMDPFGSEDDETNE